MIFFHIIILLLYLKSKRLGCGNVIPPLHWHCLGHRCWLLTSAFCNLNSVNTFCIHLIEKTNSHLENGSVKVFKLFIDWLCWINIVVITYLSRQSLWYFHQILNHNNVWFYVGSHWLEGHKQCCCSKAPISQSKLKRTNQSSCVELLNNENMEHWKLHEN
jgi:hypothetical protein